MITLRYLLLSIFLFMKKYSQLGDKKWLEEQLQTKSIHLIAQEIGCSYSAVIYARNIHNIVIIGKEPRARRRNYDMSVVMKEAYKRKYPNGRFGVLASNWRGGRRRVGTKGSYIGIYMPSHPNAAGDGYVMEHRLVMEKKLGRYLIKNEVVNHINGNKKDNRIENIELVSDRGTHTREHFQRSHRTRQAEVENNRLRQLLMYHGINPDQVDK